MSLLHHSGLFFLFFSRTYSNNFWSIPCLWARLKVIYTWALKVFVLVLSGRHLARPPSYPAKSVVYLFFRRKKGRRKIVCTLRMKKQTAKQIATFAKNTLDLEHENATKCIPIYWVLDRKESSVMNDTVWEKRTCWSSCYTASSRHDPVSMCCLSVFWEDFLSTEWVRVELAAFRKSSDSWREALHFFG